MLLKEYAAHHLKYFILSVFPNISKQQLFIHDN